MARIEVLTYVDLGNGQGPWIGNHTIEADKIEVSEYGIHFYTEARDHVAFFPHGVIVRAVKGDNLIEIETKETKDV